MDCCICSPMASVYRPPRNTICSSCYEGARSMIALLNELDNDRGATISSHGSKFDSTKGISHAFKMMKEMQEEEKDMKEKVRFLDGLVALRNGIHTDILVRPGSGPPIPAHRALLAAKSEIFRTMLMSDECKAPADDTISLPELSHDELKCLVEFLYSGSLPEESTDKHSHSYSLLMASDKYDIPFLRKHCERRILATLHPSNALEVLEASEFCSNSSELKEQAMNTILKHAEEVVFSASYDEFARKNGHLCVEITRALLTEKKDKGGAATSPYQPLT